MLRMLPVSEVRSDFYRFVDRLSHGGDAVTLTRRGEPIAVLLSHDEYERLIDAISILCDPDLLCDADLPFEPSSA